MMKISIKDIVLVASCIAVLAAAPASAAVSCYMLSDCPTGWSKTCIAGQIVAPVQGDACISYGISAVYTKPGAPTITVSGVAGGPYSTSGDPSYCPNATYLQVSRNQLFASLGYVGSSTIMNVKCCATNLCNPGLGATFLAGASLVSASSLMLLATTISVLSLLVSTM